jgi:prepilin-type N-terminal cleavage/methylation domain-containing protein
MRRKKNGFSMLELGVVIALMAVLALMMVMHDFGMRAAARRMIGGFEDQKQQMLVVAAWQRIDVDSEAEAVAEMRRRQPTGDLPKWDTPEAAELVGLDWKVGQ